jgi:hypothetical protein
MGDFFNVLGWFCEGIGAKKSSVNFVDSPFVKGAWVRREAPRFFDYAQNDKVG